MTVARVTEISAESTRNFADAIRIGIDRANKTLRNVRGAWVKEQQVSVENGKVTSYRVNLLITFVLDDGTPVDAAGAKKAMTTAAKTAPATKAAAKRAPAKKARKAARRRR